MVRGRCWTVGVRVSVCPYTRVSVRSVGVMHRGRYGRAYPTRVRVNRSTGLGVNVGVYIPVYTSEQSLWQSPPARPPGKPLSLNTVGSLLTARRGTHATQNQGTSQQRCQKGHSTGLGGFGGFRVEHFFRLGAFREQGSSRPGPHTGSAASPAGWGCWVRWFAPVLHLRSVACGTSALSGHSHAQESALACLPRETAALPVRVTQR